MADSRNGLVSRDAHIWSLRAALLCAFLIIGGLVFTISKRQNEINVRIPPDLSEGALIKPGEYIASTTYTFANYMWREINTWPASGRTDFKAKLEVNKCHFTPTFYKELINLYKQKIEVGELERTRSMLSIIPFEDKLVKPLGAKTFGVDLYINMIEELDKFELKNVNLHYPIRVVPDTRKCNRFGQALDGFYREAAIVTEKELEAL